MTDHLVLDAGPRPGGAASSKAIEAVATLPMFTADVGAASDPVVAALRARVRDATKVTIRATATCGGAPGSILNALMQLGGAQYGLAGRGDSLAGKSVLLDVTGNPRDIARARRQLARMLRALGADDITSIAAPDTAANPDVDWSRLGDAQVPGPLVNAALGQVVLPEHPWLRKAHHAVAETVPRYGVPGGTPQLRGVLREWLDSRGTGRDRALTVTSGASMALTAALATLVPPGGTVLVPDPGYPPYVSVLRRFGLRALPYPVPPSGARLAPDAFVHAEQASAVLWNSPSNPTGWVADVDDLEVLARCVRRHDLTVISDEVYRDLAWSAAPAPAGPCDVGLAEHTVVLDSVSKRHAAAGIRIGWAHGPPAQVAAIRSAHWELAMSPPVTTQAQAALLLAEHDTILAAVRRHLGAALDRVPEKLRPDAGPYLWLPCPDGNSGAVVADRLAGRVGLRVMPGEVFGARGAGHVRINLGDLDDEGAAALHRALELLDGWGRVAW